MHVQGSRIVTKLQQPTAKTKLSVEAQFLECKAELRNATIERAQREVDDPDLYWRPDTLQRELAWTIAELRKQFIRLEQLYLSERAELIFIGCLAGEHRYCKMSVDGLTCSCDCHAGKRDKR